MSRITDNVSLGRPLGVPLGVQKMVLVLVGIFAVYGFLTKNAVQAAWFPLLYGSIYLHELGHALSTRAFGGHVEGISIHIVGGLTHTRGVRGVWSRVLMTAAGPAVNLALGLVLYLFVVPDPVTSQWGAVLYGLMFANLLWGFFNVLPIYPLDGGHILQTLAERRLPHAKATALSATVSFVAIGATGVFALAGAGFLGLQGLGIGMLFLFLLFFAWVNVQRWRMAQQAGASMSRLGALLGRAARNGDRPAPGSARGPAGRARRSMKDLAGDADHMRALLRRGAKVGLGGLTPDDRRLIMFHRTVLESELNRAGFDGLDAEQRELLALHHEMDDRAVPH